MLCFVEINQWLIYVYNVFLTFIWKRVRGLSFEQTFLSPLSSEQI